jgi:hypothetical protein
MFIENTACEGVTPDVVAETMLVLLTPGTAVNSSSGAVAPVPLRMTDKGSERL